MIKITQDEFEKIVTKINEKENFKLDFTYEEYISYIKIIRDKIKYNKNVYKENKKLFNLSELAVLTWGLLAFSTMSFKNNNKDDNLLIVFHALSTQISNNNLAILNLCNSALEYQTGILMRSNIESCYLLLVLMLNKEKRKKYFDTAKLDNDRITWQKEFKTSLLNKEIEKYEQSVFKDDDLLKEMSLNRKSIYEHYSKYTHPSFLVCFLNSYTYSDNPNEILKFNVWGEESTRISKELISLCKLNLIIYLELFYYIVGKIDIKK